MKPIVGIFKSSDQARQAAEQLLYKRMPNEEVRLLTPADAQHHLEAEVPTDDAETGGIGMAIGAVLGGAIALAAASHLGALFLSNYIVQGGAEWTFLALGIVTAGALGAIGGAKVVGRLEQASVTGLPHDDLFLYRDALQHGNSVVMAFARNEERSEFFRELMDDFGAVSLDAAREEWWIGLRSAEGEHYLNNESAYRLGFEAAQNPDFQGREFNLVARMLAVQYGNMVTSTEFQRGYERGLDYAREHRQAA